MTINRTEGGGPWTFENEQSLDPGDKFRFNFNTDEKGRYRDWAPMDSVVVKNFSTSHRITILYNGKFEYVIDPNGVDTFDRAGVIRFEVTNEGTGTIDPGDVIVSTSVEPYDADEAALEEKQTPPLKRMFKNKLGL